MQNIIVLFNAVFNPILLEQKELNIPLFIWIIIVFFYNNNLFEIIFLNLSFIYSDRI